MGCLWCSAGRSVLVGTVLQAKGKNASRVPRFGSPLAGDQVIALAVLAGPECPCLVDEGVPPCRADPEPGAG